MGDDNRTTEEVYLDNNEIKGKSILVRQDVEPANNGIEATSTEPIEELPEDIELTDIKGEEQEEEHTILMDRGPFHIHPLIQHLPSELKYTCFDAYDLNLYLGTDTGELLHYFEIERNNYMLVSQTKFNDDFDYPIFKFLLLPKIERAYILSNGTLTQFLLPEFAPAPNVPGYNGIIDISIRGYSENSNSYKLYIFSEEHIEELRIRRDGVTSSKIYKSAMIDKAYSHNQILMTAKLNNYELLNLKNSHTIPLFRISEGESEGTLNPIISNFSTNEFLVVSGGTSPDTEAMVFVINHDGDITSGAIVLDRYPRNVLVKYPYVIVSFACNEIQIFNLSTSGEAKLIQKAKSPLSGSLDLNISNTIKKFSNYESRETKEMKALVVEKLSLTPLTNIDNNFLLDGERIFLEQIFNESTSLAIYGKSGIHLLTMKPPILDFNRYDEFEIDIIRNYLNETRKPEFSKYEKVEREYLQTLNLLLITLHCTEIDESIIMRWSKSVDVSDLRLLFYLFDWKIYGNLWIFNGLAKFIKNLRSLKLINKCSNIKLLLKIITYQLQKTKKKDLVKDYSNVIRTVDINLFKFFVDDKEKIDLNIFADQSLSAIQTIVEETPGRNPDLLLEILTKRNRYTDILQIFKSENEINRMLDCIKINFDKFPTDYITEKLLDDLLYIVNGSESLSNILINDVINILSLAKIDPRELIAKLNKNINAKVLFTKLLSTKNTNDVRFLLDFYTTNIQGMMEEKNLWDNFGRFTAEYSKDLNHLKCSLIEFLNIKLKYDESCQNLLKLLKDIKSLCLQEASNYSLINFTIDEIKKFDIGNILLFLFLLPEYEDICEQYISSKKLFDIYNAYNDFQSIEKYLNADNFVEIIKHYKSLSEGPDSTKLVLTVLKRNLNLINSTSHLLNVLNELPPDYSLEALFNVLFPILKKLDSQKRDTEIRKSFVKNELTLSSNLLNNVKELDS